MSPPAIPLSVPHLAGNERAYLDECLRTNFVSSVGPFVERFENAFAAYVGARFAVATASGTAALHLAMRLLEVGPGDEVFVPSFSFVASVNPVLYQGATPVLVDSEERTWNADPERIVDEIQRRARAGQRLPKAVEIAHILGHPADLEPVLSVCAEFAIPILEDAAEALGARYLSAPLAGKHVGTLGRLGCFSFNGNKVLTTGGGGMIVTDDPELARRGRHLARQARVPGPDYLHDEVGYNYRLTNLAAALGVAQLEQLDGFLARKREIAAAYDAACDGIPALVLPPRQAWAASSCWLYSILIAAHAGRDRHTTRAALAARGIEARSIWAPAHRMAPFRAFPVLGGSVAESLHARGLSLPSSVGLDADQQRLVISVLREALLR